MDSNSPTVEEFYNEKQENNYNYEHGATLDNDKDIQEYINTYCLSMYDLFYEGKI